jgi:hypothetical protein
MDRGRGSSYYTAVICPVSLAIYITSETILAKSPGIRRMLLGDKVFASL